MTDAASLVLASSSRYRAELLARLGVPFVTRRSTIDERAFDALFADSEPSGFALRLAEAKADDVAATVRRERRAEAWVLAADQLAILPDTGASAPTLLCKPGTVAAAVDQLMQLAGREHHLVTGVVLQHVATGRRLHAVDRVVLHMRSFGRPEATEYVEQFMPLDCVGSYRIEDAGIRLFRAIDGADPTSIMGLPLLATAALLRAVGLLPT